MSSVQVTEIDDALLRAWPLPQPHPDGDKEGRGRVLVVAGSREMPGAAILAGTAALRAGAGKLVIATPASAAPAVAGAMPEARVIALPESSDGSPTRFGLPPLQALAPSTGALLVGPGMTGREGTLAFVLELLPLFGESPIVLDALAMDIVRSIARFERPVVLTPHAGEMAHLTGNGKEEVKEEALDTSLRQARTWNAVLALKGATTVIATPDQRAWIHRTSAPGLGTSGSGDVLAGIIAGLAARGAAPEQAMAWGVALHAQAGLRLAARIGALGFLARELPGEVPQAMRELAGER